MGQDVVEQNFVGQDVAGAISLGQNVVGQEVSGAGSVSPKISINIPNIFVFVGTNK